MAVSRSAPAETAMTRPGGVDDLYAGRAGTDRDRVGQPAAAGQGGDVLGLLAGRLVQGLQHRVPDHEEQQTRRDGQRDRDDARGEQGEPGPQAEPAGLQWRRPHGPAHSAVGGEPVAHAADGLQTAALPYGASILRRRYPT